MSKPEIKIGCVSNVYTRMMHFKNAGDVEHGHSHVFDHLTMLSSGSLRVTVNDQSTEFKAPFIIFIKAGKKHELTALEDNTVACCIHALRDGDDVSDIVDPASIPDGVSIVDIGITKSLIEIKDKK